MNELNLSGRLMAICWIFYLNFLLHCEYKPIKMCKQVIHLTTFSKDLVLIHLEDDFLDENLTIIKATPTWYNQNVEFLNIQQMLLVLSKNKYVLKFTLITCIFP